MARREWQNPSVLSRESAAGAEWYIRYRVKVLKDGKIERVEKWKALGLCAKMTQHQAGREKDRIMRDVNTQIFTAQSQMKFADVLAAFREQHIPSLAEPSQKTYKQHLHAYIEPRFKDSRLCDVGTLQIEQMFSAMQANGLSRATRTTTKGIMKSIFGCARKWQYTDQNPVKLAQIGGGPRRVRECRVPSLEDVGRLMDACEGDVPLLIETLYTTGMRISEAAGLRVGDLNFTDGAVSVCRRNCRGSVGDTKSERGTRRLGLGNVAVKLLAHVQGRAADDLVFTWQGKALVDNTLLADYLTPIMESLGIKFPGFGWHSFRRLHITLMDQRGLSLAELQRQAGHADVRTTMRYIADGMDRRAEAAKNLPQLVVVKKKTA
jgi:integrase